MYNVPNAKIRNPRRYPRGGIGGGNSSTTAGVGNMSKLMSAIKRIRKNRRLTQGQKLARFIGAYNQYEPPISSNKIIDYNKEVKRMTTYLKVRGEREFGEYAESLVPHFFSLNVGEVKDIYKLVRKQYLALKARYIMGIFSPRTLGDIFIIVDYGLTKASITTYKFLINKIPKSYLVRGAKLEILIKKIGLMGVRGNKTFIRIVTTSNPVKKASKLFEKLTKNAITKTTSKDGVIKAYMGNNNYITFRPLNASSSGYKATIDFNFKNIWAKPRIIKFK